MSNDFINIDMRSYRVLKGALDSMAKYKYPLAVKRTLNDVVFDMKGRKGARGTMEKRANAGFEHKRSKTFIKAMTGARKAVGTNVNRMHAGAGVMAKSGKERAAKGLAKQENADPVKHGFTPTDDARVGGSRSRNVSSRFRHGKLNYVDLTRIRKKNIMKMLILAQKAKKAVYIKHKSSNKKYIAKPIGNKIEKFAGRSNIRTGKTTYASRVPLKFLYRKNPGGVARLKKSVPFVQRAGKDSLSKFDTFFMNNFDKLTK